MQIKIYKYKPIENVLIAFIKIIITNLYLFI